jgi:TolA-binding protein
MTAGPSSRSAKIDALLQAERAIPAQSDEVRARVLKRARGALNLPVVTQPAAALSRRLVWTGAATLVVAALGLGGYLRWHRSPELAATAPEASPEKGSPDEAPPPTEPAPRMTGAFPETSASPALAAQPEKNRAPREDDMGELRLLERAREALTRGNFAEAWSALTTHERRFPRGRLTEEREALEVNALLGLGRRDDAERVATDFRKRFPHSVLLARMENVLKGQ